MTAIKANGMVKLLTVCTVKGKVVIDGDALVMPTLRSARRHLIVGAVGRWRYPPPSTFAPSFCRRKA